MREKMSKMTLFAKKCIIMISRTEQQQFNSFRNNVSLIICRDWVGGFDHHKELERKRKKKNKKTTHNNVTNVSIASATSYEATIIDDKNANKQGNDYYSVDVRLWATEAKDSKVETMSRCKHTITKTIQYKTTQVVNSNNSRQQHKVDNTNTTTTKVQFFQKQSVPHNL